MIFIYDYFLFTKQKRAAASNSFKRIYECKITILGAIALLFLVEAEQSSS